MHGGDGYGHDRKKREAGRDCGEAHQQYREQLFVREAARCLFNNLEPAISRRRREPTDGQHERQD